jgi:alkylhydroperoxidase/carboxymuconolactone decarboxylase family protein YurZ
LELGVNPWEVFVKEKPDVVKAYQELMKHINKNNVLDNKTMALIYVGIYSTIREAGALRHFIGEALNAGGDEGRGRSSCLTGIHYRSLLCRT